MEKIQTECCSVCNSSLFEYYPEDYPDEWKFCCSCYAVAWLSVELPNKPQKILDIIDHVLSCSLCQIMVQEMKTGVYNKITLVGK